MTMTSVSTTILRRFVLADIERYGCADDGRQTRWWSEGIVKMISRNCIDTLRARAQLNIKPDNTS